MGETPQDCDGSSVGTGNRHVEGDPTQLQYLAVAAMGIALTCTLLATLVSPSFAWREHALSNLGVTWTDAGTTVTALLFNGGLITGGLVGVAFSALLYRRARRRVERVVATLCGATVGLLALVGVFPQGTTPHFPVAIAFFLFVSLTLWVAGAVRVVAGGHRSGGLSIAGGTANILTWVVWFGTTENPFEGLAIPEIVGAVIFGVWLCVYAFSLSGEASLAGATE